MSFLFLPMMLSPWAIGAAGAQVPYKHKGTGSNPVSPTMNVKARHLPGFLFFDPSFTLLYGLLHVESLTHQKWQKSAKSMRGREVSEEKRKGVNGNGKQRRDKRKTGSERDS